MESRAGRERGNVSRKRTRQIVAGGAVIAVVVGFGAFAGAAQSGQQPKPGTAESAHAAIEAYRQGRGGVVTPPRPYFMSVWRNNGMHIVRMAGERHFKLPDG